MRSRVYISIAEHGSLQPGRFIGYHFNISHLGYMTVDGIKGKRR